MRVLVLGFIACSLFGQAQSVVTGAGYSTPRPLPVAPGQVITLFVRTPQIRLEAPVTASGLPLPASLSGISVALRQTFASDAIAVPVSSVYPLTTCAALNPPVCTTLTAVAVQIPYELVPNAPGSRMPENFATLTVSENGVAGEPIALDPVAERIHVITSCDATAPPSPEPCRAAVLRPDGSTVSADNPARPGELVTVRAYGLGRVDASVATGAGAPSPGAAVSEVRVRWSPGSDSSAAPESAILVPGAVGIYAVTVRVPALPEGTLECGGEVAFNATLSLTRGVSAAGVGVCVAP